MMHFTSCRLPSAFHMQPESRIMAGMEASMMTSLGTCRLVMPLSLFTIATPGALAKAAAMSASISAFCGAGRVSILLRRSPKPLFTLTPRPSKVAACLANTGLKKVLTTWPKMIGSLTFIIVALRCTENKTPWAFASATCSSRKAKRAVRCIRAASRTSPAPSDSSFFTVTVPSADTWSILTFMSDSQVKDFSLEQKSPLPIVAT
mmetsp:Transcript_18856/g.21072  ORF Transcript_18856/g.21072 Transcript_18856/m.21072 type:complete len:205 (-) Transcript_18856:541-1155(-)